MSDTENFLLRRIANGDKSAVSQFIDCYGGLLWSLALRFNANRADAEDAVQDACIAIWKAAERFDPSIASEKTYVSMIARRRYIDRNRRKQLEYSSDEVAAIVEPQNDASQLAEQKDEVQKAVNVLNELPSDQSRTIRLAIFGGLSHSQIASATGLSLGTVKTHIRRGLITMRQRIGGSSPVGAEGGVA